jgi:predicted MFS family arabinose efflux permease
MDRKRLGWAIVAIGAVLAAVSALADPLGLGEGGGVGWKQITGIVVGAAVVLGGVALVYLQRGGDRVSQPGE